MIALALVQLLTLYLTLYFSFVVSEVIRMNIQRLTITSFRVWGFWIKGAMCESRSSSKVALQRSHYISRLSGKSSGVLHLHIADLALYSPAIKKLEPISQWRYQISGGFLNLMQLYTRRMAAALKNFVVAFCCTTIFLNDDHFKMISRSNIHWRRWNRWDTDSFLRVSTSN